MAAGRQNPLFHRPQARFLAAAAPVTLAVWQSMILGAKAGEILSETFSGARRRPRT
jgi:hypothetical protein